MSYVRPRLFLAQINKELESLHEDTIRDSRPANCFLSDEQIEEHHDVHYKGYLDGYKKALKSFASCSFSDPLECRSVLHELSFNYNGVLLHQLYFESLGHSELSKSSKRSIDDSFGNFGRLKAALVGTCTAAKGWAVLGYSHLDGNLTINLLDAHDIYGMFIQPILALDMYEHAYYIDFKSGKEEYINALVEDINWDNVSQRLDKIL